MTPREKDKIVALCEKWGLKELNFTKGLYLAEDGTGITVNLRGDVPLVGVTIAGQLHTEGHGNLKVEDYQREIEAIMKSSSKKSHSSRNEEKQEVKDGSNKIVQKSEDQNVTTRSQKKEIKGGQESSFFKSSSTEQKGSNPVSGRINKDLEESDGNAKRTKQNDDRSMSSESKLGTPDTSVVQSGQRAEILEIPGFNSPAAPTPKLQKAKCKECHTEFELTLDAAQKTYEEYGAIYCMKCRSKEIKHEEKETKNEKKEGDNKVMETKIKTCILCGLELSAARALECFQEDMRFICEDCEEKEDMGFIHEDVTKTNGEKKMDEKLPAINENKLTIAVIKQYICPTATDVEAYNFLQLCVHRDLNPFLKEAYLIKYGTAPATMVVGKDAFTKKAEESGKLDGFEAGIIIKTSDGRIDRRVGVIQYEGDILVGGWAKIFRKDMKYPFVCEVPLSEYMKYKDGKPQSSWATIPGTMIRKVALVQALREAFTRELGGCYDAVEMGTQDNLK